MVQVIYMVVLLTDSFISNNRFNMTVYIILVWIWIMNTIELVITISHYISVLVKLGDQQSLYSHWNRCIQWLVYSQKIILRCTLATNRMKEYPEWSCCSWTYIPYFTTWTASLHFMSSLPSLYINLWIYSEFLLYIDDRPYSISWFCWNDIPCYHFASVARLENISLHVIPKRAHGCVNI